MVSQQANVIDVIINGLKNYPGFKAYIILNNDGIALRWETNSKARPLKYEEVVHYSHHIMDLCAKSNAHIKQLFDQSDNLVESIRLRTEQYEMIIGQQEDYTLVVIQDDKDLEDDSQEDESQKPS